jgi:hypothetical protein
MRSKTSRVRIWRPPFFIVSLTLPWVMPHAIAIWVWLAPVYWRTRWKTARMSREVRAWIICGCRHSDSGMTIGSDARPDIGSPSA